MQLNPEVMKRRLPANINATVDQVTANVNAAVDEIINNFIKNAETMVADIEKDNAAGKYTGKMAQALDQAKKELNDGMSSMEARLSSVAAAAAAADKLSKQAVINAAELAKQLAEVNQAAADLKTELNEFRTKVDTFASKSGGFLVSSAFKAVGVPI